MRKRSESSSGVRRWRVPWPKLATGLVVAHVRRAKERVMERRERAVEAGRLGGEVAAVPGIAPAASPGPAASPAASSQRKGSADEAVHPPKGGIVEVAKGTFKEFGKDNGTMMAAGIAFYTMLSLVPMVLVAVAIFGYLLGGEEARHTVMQFVENFFPAQRQMLEGAIDFVQHKRGAIGGVGLLGLVLTAAGGFNTLETAINIAWDAAPRSFIRSKLFSLLMMVVIGALLALSVGVTTLVSMAAEIPPLKWMAESIVARVVGYLVSFGISGLMFTSIYKLFPNVKTEWKPSLVAGFCIAFFWELFKIGYAWYSASKFGNQEATQGTLATFVGLIVWIYYSTILVLLGAELAWLLSGRPSRGGAGKGGPGSAPTAPAPGAA